MRAVEKDRRQRDRGGEPAAADTGESVVVVPAVVVIVVPAVFVVSVVVVIVVVTPALIFPSVVVPAAVIAVVIVVVGRGWRLRVWLRGRNGCGCRRRLRVGFGFGRRLGGPTVLAALASRLPRRPLVTVGLGPRTVPAARTVIARRCLGRFELLELDADGWAERSRTGPAGGGQQCTEDHPDQQGGKQDGNGEAAHGVPG
ncbi:MAG: hypothetical protein M3425_09785 [Actinomycetota bacterium]|nr:hypothetical protein [Actinomycetota bacterium]